MLVAINNQTDRWLCFGKASENKSGTIDPHSTSRLDFDPFEKLRDDPAYDLVITSIVAYNHTTKKNDVIRVEPVANFKIMLRRSFVGSTKLYTVTDYWS